MRSIIRGFCRDMWGWPLIALIAWIIVATVMDAPWWSGLIVGGAIGHFSYNRSGWSKWA